MGRIAKFALTWSDEVPSANMAIRICCTPRCQPDLAHSAAKAGQRMGDRRGAAPVLSRRPPFGVLRTLAFALTSVLRLRTPSRHLRVPRVRRIRSPWLRACLRWTRRRYATERSLARVESCVSSADGGGP